MEPRRGNQTARLPESPQAALILQSKLHVGVANDEYEREADHIADDVAHMPEPPVRHPCPCGGGCPRCQSEQSGLIRKRPRTRRHEVGAGHEISVPRIVHDVLRASGHPLDPATLAFMGPRIGHDFSGVRVHLGSTAAQSAQAVGARAFTLGNHIVFGSGQYAPGTTAGRLLLAHELTHVVQQGFSPHSASTGEVPLIQRASAVGGDAALCEGTTHPPAIPWFSDPMLVRVRIDEALLAFGAMGEPVSLVQEALVAWGCEEGPGHLLPKFGVDGIFGSETRAAVRTFQTGQGIADDGVVGPITLGELDGFVLGGVLQCPSGTTATNLVAESQPTTTRTTCLPLQIPPGKACPTPATSGHTGKHEAVDNFNGHSPSKYGVGEGVNLAFDSINPEVKQLPPGKRAEFFGGGRWVIVSGPGTVTTPDLNAGTARYTADHNAGAVELALQVALGPCKGSTVAVAQFEIVKPDRVRIRALPGTAPDFGGQIPPGNFGAGFLGEPMIGPENVSFKGIMFREGEADAKVTPPGSFLDSPNSSDKKHPVGAFAPGDGGNAQTGTPVLVVDQIRTAVRIPPCGDSDFLWQIPWQFKVAGSNPEKFAEVTHRATAAESCDATIEKAGAGPFCRRLNGSSCST